MFKNIFQVRVHRVTLWLPVLIIAVSLASAQSGSIVHQPVFQHDPAEPLVIYAMVNSDQEVYNIRLLYRLEGETGFIELPLNQYGDVWRTQIPRSNLSATELEYFLAADLDNGEIITYPAQDPENNPVSVRLQTVGTVDLRPGIMAAAPKVAGTGAGEILIFSPDPESTVPAGDVYIAASLYNVPAVDVATIKLRIDGRDVSKQADISADLVAYSPLNLTPGRHFVQVSAKNQAGQSIPVKGWYFSVVTAEEFLAEVNGHKSSISYRGKLNGSYSHDPQGGGDYLDVYKTSASFSSTYNNITVKADIRLTSDEDPYKQPKNRLRFNTSAGKWLNMDFGDFSSRHSKYTLDGKRVRGIGFDLTGGYVNLHVVKGELARSIQGRTTLDQAYTGTLTTVTNADDSTVTDLIYQLDRKGYTFQQDVLAARLSFGSGRYAQWGINILKAKDNIASVDRDIDEALLSIPEVAVYDTDSNLVAYTPGGVYEYGNRGDLDTQTEPGYNLLVGLPEDGSWAGEAPQDNIVVGTDLKININKRRITLEGGLAFSMLNTNIWEGPITKADLDILIDDSSDGFIGQTYDENGNIIESGFISLDDIPIDPGDYENLFVINQNMVPLVPIDLDSALLADNPLKAVMQMPSLAYNYKMTANYFNNYFSLEYKRIGPKFKSLANPYLQSDVRELLVSDRVRLLKNRLFVGGSYRRQDNNTIRTVSTVNTTETYTLNLGVYPGVEYPSVNIKFSAKPRFNDNIVPDTTAFDSVDVYSATDTVREQTGYYLSDNRMDENTINASIGLNYGFSALGQKHNVAVNYNRLQRFDRIKDRWESGDGSYDIDADNDTTFYDTTFISPKMTSNVTTLSWATQYTIPLKTTVVFSFNNQATADAKQAISSLTVGATYGMFKNRLRLVGGLGFVSGTGSSEFKRYNIKGGVNYRILEDLSVRCNATLRNVKTGGESESSVILRADIAYLF